MNLFMKPLALRLAPRGPCWTTPHGDGVDGNGDRRTVRIGVGDRLKLKARHPYPIHSMYAIYAYIDPSNHPNVGIYTIHGAFGYYRPIVRHDLFGTASPDCREFRPGVVEVGVCLGRHV